jgi:hypothetical protein
MILLLIPFQRFTFCVTSKHPNAVRVRGIKQFTPERVEPSISSPHVLERFLRSLLNLFQSNVRRISRRVKYRRFASFQSSGIFSRERRRELRELFRQRRPSIVLLLFPWWCHLLLRLRRRREVRYSKRSAKSAVKTE